METTKKSMYVLSDAIGIFETVKDSIDTIESWLIPENFTVESSGYIPSMIECAEIQLTQLKTVIRNTPEYLGGFDSSAETKIKESTTDISSQPSISTSPKFSNTKDSGIIINKDLETVKREGK